MMAVRLSEVHGLLIRGSEGPLPHPLDLFNWERAGWVRLDDDTMVLHLTAAGQEILKWSCENCNSWRAPNGQNTGECWSGDRLDGDLSKGPAGWSRDYQTCEAFIAKTDLTLPELMEAE